MDRDWWKRYRQQARQQFQGALVSPLANCYGVRRIDFAHYENSGAGAIALAAHLGAVRIILLGYDCQLTGGKAHWHGDHPQGLGNAGSLPKWPAQFASLATALKGVQVVNCTRKSALTCFAAGQLDAELGRNWQESVIVRGMRGLGDNIYQRACIRHIRAQVYLDTPWPQLYSDLPHVHCIRADTMLRTQARNVREADYEWAQEPKGARQIRLGYGDADLRAGSMVQALCKHLHVDRVTFDLPELGVSPIQSTRPVAIVRPVTVRREWLNTARNPMHTYIAQAADELRRRGYYVVSVADLEPGQEWLDGPAPPADEVLHRGELNVLQLLAAVRHAQIVVGGVGWIVPACIAAGTPLYCVLGGQLGHNAPQKITDPAAMDLSKVGWAWPDRPCRCSSKTHNCNKVINGFDRNFSAWLDRQGLFASHEAQPDLAA